MIYPQKISQSAESQSFGESCVLRSLALVSLCLFVLILIVSLCTPLIANDKPLYVHYQGEHLLPMLQAYPETRFEGDFETPTNYHDPAVLKLIHQNGDLWMPLIKYGEQTLRIHWEQIKWGEMYWHDYFMRCVYR
ncbi:Inner membrane ABC transporter permease protein yejE [Moraxella veridica]|uniref:Oligopeptide/dipeptide uptake family ABC transporter, permease protein n=1 Tax=Moraxella catarrhalis TaxID=480 RepID=A0A7Z0V015_MORCA|nr:hypothetical protein [Moraxella catarrhalis]OAV01963.1 Oligopeptide/dipeptide uptake family ABC transporter, permease protein [Moraxella catarrhalis]STY82127.1 Inner membrane ABC transporter permease protein yejE [Moraxella catarrhalis]